MNTISAEPTSKLEVISTPARLRDLRSDWNRLATANLFLSWEWLDCWWRHFGSGAELCVQVAWDGPELAAGLALGRRGRHAWALANRETDLFRPIGRSHEDMASVLHAAANGGWSRLTLPAVPIHDGTAERMARALREEGWLVDETFKEICPFVDTTGDFEEYRRRLSSNARGQLRNYRRRLDREGEVEVTTLAAPAADEPLDALLEQCFALEAAGWKGRAGGAIAAEEKLVGFWQDLFRRFFDLGSLRISLMRLDGVLIAFSLEVLHSQRLYLLKTSYDERYGRFSPGNLLRMAIIEASFGDDEIVAHEFLGPMLRWKERYATDSRRTAVLRAYRRTPAALSRYAARRHLIPRIKPAYRSARHTLDRLRGRRGAAPAQGAGRSRQPAGTRRRNCSRT